MSRIGCLVLFAIALMAGEAEPVSLAPKLLSADRAVLLSALTELANRGPVAANELEIARMRIADADPLIRLGAVTALSRLRDDGAIPQLISALRSAEGDLANDMRLALAKIVGNDIGGKDPSAWASWYQSVLNSTTTGITAVRAAVTANDFDQAKKALHPLMVQRACREQVILLLQELGSPGRDPGLTQLAREGLAGMDAALARMVLAKLDPRYARKVAETRGAAGTTPGGPVGTTPFAAIDPVSEPTGPPKQIWGWVAGGAIVIGLLFLLWHFGKRWMAAHPAVQHATRMFVVRMKTRRFSNKK